MATKERHLTPRHARIAHAVATKLLGWDTHPLFEIAYDAATDGVLRAARSFDGERFREDQFDAWLVYNARRDAWGRLERHRKRKIKKDPALATDLEDVSNWHERKQRGCCEPDDPFPQPLEGLIEEEEWGLLQKWMGRLTSDERDVVERYFSVGITVDYARSIGLKTRQAVYHRINRALSRLREMAEKECGL